MLEAKENQPGGLQIDVPVDTSIHDGQIAWTDAEEKAAIRKFDLFLMPLLVSGFFVLQLDRSNLSNALTDTIAKDLNMTSDQINFGGQLMSIGIVIADVPSNLILQKLGASAWCTNIHSFYATRFLLGLSEGGYIPGSQYMLALFYTRRELAQRTKILYFGYYSATATGSLIAAGVLQIGGIQGLSGWQWLFLLEGVATLLLSIVFFAIVSRNPTHTTPLHGRWGFTTDQKRHIIHSRVLADDETKADSRAPMSFHAVFEAAKDYRLWLHMILNTVSLAPKGGLILYGPTVIKSLGFSKINANILNAVSSVLLILFSYLISLGSGKTHLRGSWCIIAFVHAIAFAGALFGLPVDADRWARYAVFMLLGACSSLARGINDAWVNINAATSTKRSLGLAFVVMGGEFGECCGAAAVSIG